MKIKTTAATLSLMMVSAVQAAPAQTSPMFAKAKALIAERSVDPSSVQYRKLRVVRATVQGKAMSIACGEYNGKNRLGGYNGFKTFAYETTTLKGVMTFDGSSFDMITADGNDLGSSGAFEEVNARIVAVCLGMSQ